MNEAPSSYRNRFRKGSRDKVIAKTGTGTAPKAGKRPVRLAPSP